MKAELVLTGQAELYAALRALPAELAGDGAAILVDHANQCAAAIAEAYPIGPDHRRKGVVIRGGTLKAKVRVDQVVTSRDGASARVVSGAPHAHLYEFGTARGGRAHPTFVPAVQRTRKSIFTAQVALVRRAGFVVSGVPI